VYAAEVDDHILTFEVFGVWRKNMLMHDRETDTLWQQATGEAIDGPLKDDRLTVLFSQEMTWGSLTASVPQAKFALAPDQHTGFIPIRWIERLLALARRIHLRGLEGVDHRLDAHELVIGVVVAGEAKAYPLTVLQSRPVLHDRVGGQDLTITYHPADDRVVIQGEEDRNLPHQRQWWLAWSEFHPRSAIYSVEDNE